MITKKYKYCFKTIWPVLGIFVKACLHVNQQGPLTAIKTDFDRKCLVFSMMFIFYNFDFAFFIILTIRIYWGLRGQYHFLKILDSSGKNRLFSRNVGKNCLKILLFRNIFRLFGSVVHPSWVSFR